MANKWLYKCFDHWFRGGQVYFYSDPHFGDDEMVYLRKNYIGDEEQVKRINAKIGKSDTLILLGDIGDKSWLSKIRGYKVLITGNHDSGQETFREYVNEVYDGILTISKNIVLSHEPIDVKYALNIHGHDHALWYPADALHINMCAEHIGYTPVSLKNIVLSGMLKGIPNIHRETIDTATENRRKKS